MTKDQVIKDFGIPAGLTLFAWVLSKIRKRKSKNQLRDEQLDNLMKEQRLQAEMHEQLGVTYQRLTAEYIKQNALIEKQNTMIERQNVMIEEQNVMIEELRLCNKELLSIIGDGKVALEETTLCSNPNCEARNKYNQMMKNEKYNRAFKSKDS